MFEAIAAARDLLHQVHTELRNPSPDFDPRAAATAIKAAAQRIRKAHGANPLKGEARRAVTNLLTELQLVFAKCTTEQSA